MKSLHQQRVERFMVGAGHTIPDKPALCSTEKLKLQATLLFEEFLETVRAMGLDPWIGRGHGERLEPEDLGLTQMGEPDLIELADGLADLSVVTIGSLSLLGIHDESLLAEVDSNNLLKLAKGTHREDGKFCKAKDHPRPDIERVLAKQTHDNKIEYELAVHDYLDELFQERDSIHRDAVWLRIRHLQEVGLTPSEAASKIFKEILNMDIDKPQTG